MPVHEQFEVIIPSDTEAGQAVQERIVSRLESLEYSVRDVFGVRLALEEALVNAIKHGNGLDPDKTVRVNCLVHDERRVQREGKSRCLGKETLSRMMSSLSR